MKQSSSNPKSEDVRGLQNRINALIEQRTRYGLRKEATIERAYVLYWSNLGHWEVEYEVPRATVLQLDANEVLVSDADKDDLKYLCDAGLKYLKPLPLWGGSFERMGSPDYTGVELPPMIKHIRDLNLPLTKEVEDALRKKAEESNPRSKAGCRLRKIGEYFDGKETCWIWLVDGKKVRDHVYIDFTMGNHHYVAATIPEDEIWIDNSNYKERWEIIQHEVHERNLMKFKHMSYPNAHDRANRTEKKYRAVRANPSRGRHSHYSSFSPAVPPFSRGQYSIMPRSTRINKKCDICGKSFHYQTWDPPYETCPECRKEYGHYSEYFNVPDPRRRTMKGSEAQDLVERMYQGKNPSRNSEVKRVLYVVARYLWQRLPPGEVFAALQECILYYKNHQWPADQKYAAITAPLIKRIEDEGLSDEDAQIMLVALRKALIFVETPREEH